MSSFLVLLKRIYIVALPVALLAQDSIESNNDTKVQKLNAVTTTANSDEKTYNSANRVSREIIESNPNGNGDISSILKILPNAQVNNASRSSNSPGEINPANISISGSLSYQNSFQLDGFEMNNDINPAGSSGNAWAAIRSSQSQGLNVDTSLLDSINVLDSNISAAYGRFSGGVIEANVRKPRKILNTESKELFGSNGLYGYHANISYQTTSNELTSYHIPDGLKEVFEGSTNELYQPNFIKHALRASLEGYITQNLGLILSYSTIRSYIPLQLYNNGTSTQSQTQHRISDNYYIKLNYDIHENLDLDFSLAYMPSDNRYFTANRKNSLYSMQGGGIQSGVKLKWQSDLGLWTNSLSYSRLDNNRRSDANYWTEINGSEGQYGDLDQTQDNANFKSDMIFDSINIWKSKHTFRSGLELGYVNAMRNRLEDVYLYTSGYWCNIAGGGESVAICGTTATNAWNGSVDNFGFISANNTRFYKSMAVARAGKSEFDTFNYALYLEDDINFDLNKFGNLNARLGVRLDGDNYLNKHKIAPRFSLSYITPFIESYATTFSFGANRYYARNLLAYRMYADAVNNRTFYERNNANESFSPVREYANNQSNPVQLNELDVPYDDELMGAISQNLGIFTLNLKYIHRDGKNQVMPKSIQNGNAYTYEWSNNGWSKSDIINLSMQNIKPIDTYGIKHFYMFSLEWNNTTRNHNSTLNEDTRLESNVVYNGVTMRYSQMPAQKVNVPLTAKLNMTHSYVFNSKYRILWNNFFRFKGSYERIVLENYRASTTRYVDKTFKPSFMWDMRLGFEADIWRKNTLYVNLDIYNVMNLKNEIALSSADGIILPGIRGEASIVAYELGAQLWAQVGYKF